MFKKSWERKGRGADLKVRENLDKFKFEIATELGVNEEYGNSKTIMESGSKAQEMIRKTEQNLERREGGFK